MRQSDQYDLQPDAAHCDAGADGAFLGRSVPALLAACTSYALQQLAFSKPHALRMQFTHTQVIKQQGNILSQHCVFIVVR